MIDLIGNRLPELEALCRKYGVKTLEVFGSAADGTWDPLTSDLDFLFALVPKLCLGTHLRETLFRVAVPMPSQ